MNAIVTVIGKDKVGIIAAVCIKLAEMNVNVLDISQTILDGKFTMVMAVDAANANVGFEELKVHQTVTQTAYSFSTCPD